MKKKNLVFLIIVCMLFLCLFSGLLVYAFQLQNQKDLKSISSKQSAQTSSVPTVTKTPSAAISPAPTKAAKVTDAALTPTASNSTAAGAEPTPYVITAGANSSGRLQPVVLGFAGDVNLDENYYPAAKYDSVGGNIEKCFSLDLLKEMKAANVMMLNNEFAYSNRGKKASGKSFAFRAKPGRVDILKKMGIDIVSLANNHALDYGQDALLDTFDTLDKAGISYVGAGSNLDRAKAPVYVKTGGRKIAFLAASRVIFAGSWYAQGSRPGMVGTYDPSLILASIKQAKANSDYVVIFVHWGVERASCPTDYQRSLARQYIDAGADAVIGCHPHVMQGFEYYKGKPIAYSLSNYWFNGSVNKSALLKLYIDTDGTVKVQLRPVMNKNTYTYLLQKDADKKSYYDYIRKISFHVKIDRNGYITAAK